MVLTISSREPSCDFWSSGGRLANLSSHQRLWLALASGSRKHFLCNRLRIPGSLAALESAARAISTATVSRSLPIPRRASSHVTSLACRRAPLFLRALCSLSTISSPRPAAPVRALAIRIAREWSWSGTPSILQLFQMRSHLVSMRSITGLSTLCRGPSSLDCSICFFNFCVFRRISSRVFFIERLAVAPIAGRQVDLTCIILRLDMCLRIPRR